MEIHSLTSKPIFGKGKEGGSLKKIYIYYIILRDYAKQARVVVDQLAFSVSCFFFSTGGNVMQV
jgi:hypothetical protein